MMEFHKKQRIEKILLLSALLWMLLLNLTALSAQALEDSSGGAPNGYQSYLEQSPIRQEEFVQNPIRAVWEYISGDLASIPQDELRSYADILCCLLVLSVGKALLAGTSHEPLLEMLGTASCGLLLWQKLLGLSDYLGEALIRWRDFLSGFLPVYAGVLAAGGEVTSAAVAGGFFLELLCLLAQGIGSWIRPLLQCYLALAATSALCSDFGVGKLCSLVSQALRKSISWAGKLFAAILGIQRIFTASTDRNLLLTGKLLSSAVPIIGDTLGTAADVVLAGTRVLKCSLGFAGMAILCAEFLPFYLGLMAHLCILSLFGIFCRMIGLARCGELFDHTGEGVRVMAALTALFFGMCILGTALMMLAGGR